MSTAFPESGFFASVFCQNFSLNFSSIHRRCFSFAIDSTDDSDSPTGNLKSAVSSDHFRQNSLHTRTVY
ncbi:hypothetical protein L596_000411 [Steinernema carpocapsae]|uniref:Uncharacterized protein n=1 Tax=Steinernema carpocapsae TaxID=34508 RepID=A0A4U8UI33_STECR|nr:hypothetical protein L596_000411 [Steinernema carpocapsae]